MGDVRGCGGEMMGVRLGDEWLWWGDDGSEQEMWVMGEAMVEEMMGVQVGEVGDGRG